MSIYDQVDSALSSRRVVSIYYDGGVRDLCPHIIGYTDDKPYATFYQVGGYSASGNQVGWKTICLENITQVGSSSVTWVTPNTYNSTGFTKQIQDRRNWV